jgi:hypothetical protein
MKRCLSLFAFILLSFVTNAQTKTTASVKGKLIDSIAKQQLRSATLNVLSKTDSVLVSFAISKEDGSFTVFNVPAGEYLLFASFQGYETVYKPFTIDKSLTDANVGSIFLQMKAKDLGNVTVTQSPVTIKQDTVEFNANSFKTKPNSTAEDLLKKLPGVEVAKDGTVKAQGEQVKRVLVDGKRFFGDDPKMATKNIPTDMIDKIQVVDAQSDQSAFSGFDDGNREKTINIITKKDKRKGYFGKVTAGGGTDGRYTGNVNLNRFNGNQQIALISQVNNTNQQNFSIQDILGVMNLGGNAGGAVRAAVGGGGAGRTMSTGGGGNTNSFLGGSSGFTRTIAGGLNYNDVWGKKTSVSGSYFYNNINNLNEQDKNRETLTKDTSLISKSQNYTNNKNQNHRMNFEVDHKIDSMNSILIRPSISFQQSDNFNNTTSTSTKGDFYNLNAVNQTNSSSNDGYNFNNNILWRHKMQKKGRTLSLNLSQSLSNSETDGRTMSYNKIYTNTNSVINDTTDQLTNTQRETKGFGSNVSFTEPIGTKSFLELSYNFNYSLNSSDQVTMRKNGLTGKYDAYSQLTNAFENTNLSHRGNVNFRRVINKEWNYTVGLGLQRTKLESDNLTKNTQIEHWYTNYAPTVMLQYSKNRTKNLRFNYRGNTRAPSVSQLQPIQDITNQLNIRNGNPDLKQEFSHNLNVFYSRFDMSTFKNVFASLNGSFTQDKIGYEYTINEGRTPMVVDGIALIPGAQYSKPVNLNGGYNLSGFVNYGFPIKKIKGNLNFTTNLSHSRDVSLVNKTKSFTRNYGLGETLGFNMNIKDKLDLNLSSTSTYTFARYSQQPDQNGDYFTQVFSVEPTYTTKSGWVIGSDFDYTMYRGQAAGYNQTIPLLNASISKLLFKNKAGEIKLTCYDLLNENKSITRTVDQNYIEDIRTTVLQRYVMLTFTYNLRKFGQQQMPGMFNMFRGGAGGGMRQGGGMQMRSN